MADHSEGMRAEVVASASQALASETLRPKTLASETLSGRWGPLSDLPGHPMMWVLIISEILVFGGGLIAVAATRLSQPQMFIHAQDSLNRVAGTINTAVLLTSGLAAALAVNSRSRGQIAETRRWLLSAGLLGAVFLVVKAVEYWAKYQAGIGIDTNGFFTLYYLITGFHALHVVAGMAILGIVARHPSMEAIETGTSFWHMVDLIWVLLFPVLYLMR